MSKKRPQFSPEKAAQGAMVGAAIGSVIGGVALYSHLKDPDLLMFSIVGGFAGLFLLGAVVQLVRIVWHNRKK
jgi:CDP-diglyceride synthetase